MHIIEIGRRRIEVGEHRQRHVVEPDIFAQDSAGRPIGLGDEMALEVLDIVGDLRRRHRRGLPPAQPLEEVVAVVRLDLAAELELLELNTCLFRLLQILDKKWPRNPLQFKFLAIVQK